jgi:hypothetical protein
LDRLHAEDPPLEIPPRDEFDNSDDPVDPDDFGDDPNAEWKSTAALNDSDWKDLQSFHKALEKLRQVECSRCLECWFDMKLNVDKVSESCIRVDGPKKRGDDEPYMFSAANEMDPGPVPDWLPVLSPIEEMCIAKVHTFIEVRQHRGVQYKYKGHICNFLCNVGNIHRKLPLLPRELDIVVVRPANHKDSPGIAQQFKNEYRVRKEAIRM